MPGSGRLLLVGLLVALLAVAATACGADDEAVVEPETNAVERDDDDRPDEPEEPREGRWEELPPAPIDSRLNHTATWTGDRMIVWGGGTADQVLADGAAWDPGAEEWRAIPEAPIEPRWAHEAFWTGEELLVWGGTAGPDHLAECYTDGALYDPVAGEWREVPPAPGGPRCGAAAAWTGEDLLVWGGHDAVGPPRPGDLRDDGVAFSPETGEWRQLPAAPIAARHGMVSAWTGEELVVWGGTGAAGEQFADGAAFAPAADEWRAIADAPLQPRGGASGAWLDGELIVFGGRDLDVEEGARDLADAAAYNPDADAWRELPDLPAAQADARTAWTGDVLYVVGDDEAEPFVAYVAAEESWLPRPAPPEGGRRNHDLVWTGAELLLWGGQTDAGPAAGARWLPPRE
jgi:hypothetical protein